MIDPDEFADYEEWKQKRLIDGIDISVHAYNAEMELQAKAYERGVKESINASDIQKIQSTLDRNPFRRPGMRGELPATKKLTT